MKFCVCVCVVFVCRSTAKQVRRRRSSTRRPSARFGRCLSAVMLPAPRPDVDVASRPSSLPAAAAAAAPSTTAAGVRRWSDHPSPSASYLLNFLLRRFTSVTATLPSGAETVRQNWEMRLSLKLRPRSRKDRVSLASLPWSLGRMEACVNSPDLCAERKAYETQTNAKQFTNVFRFFEFESFCLCLL